MATIESSFEKEVLQRFKSSLKQVNI